MKLIVNIRGMTQQEHARLESIDDILQSETVRQQILPIIERVRAELARKKEALMTWEPIPLTVFGRALPTEIRSAWVFVLRAGANTGAERHPNSHQRMMTFEGSGDMQTGEPSQWQSNVLVSNPDAPLEQRWISIPQNVWHRPVVGADADWTVVSFHTVPENRYGNLVQRQLRDDETVSVLYHKDRYLYLVIFANDRSVSESYSHINGTDLSEKEIANFLKVNAAGEADVGH